MPGGVNSVLKMDLLKIKHLFDITGKIQVCAYPGHVV
jgi:hypothetical protein